MVTTIRYRVKWKQVGDKYAVELSSLSHSSKRMLKWLYLNLRITTGKVNNRASLQTDQVP